MPAGGFIETAVPPWLYRPDPPYQVIAYNGDTMNMIALHDFDNLSDAAAWFVRFQIGPMSGRVTGILDSNFQILVGYKRTFETDWFGTQIGFDELALHYDPISVAVWEVEAQQGRPHPTEIPQDIVP